METLVMDEQSEKSNFLDSSLKLKDVAQVVALLIGGLWFILTMNAKIDALTTAITDLKDTNNKQYATQDISIRSLQNQVNTNSVQIELIKKDLDLFRKK